MVNNIRKVVRMRVAVATEQINVQTSGETIAFNNGREGSS